MNIYVGNLARETSEAELRQAFEAFGQVSSVAIIKDKFSGE
jgi:RNA recognition motif-containing protein